MVDDAFITAEPSPLLFCATCGQPLLGDPEDEPEGDAGLPICGECDRARDFDAILSTLDPDHLGGQPDEDDR